MTDYNAAGSENDTTSVRISKLEANLLLVNYKVDRLEVVCNEVLALFKKQDEKLNVIGLLVEKQGNLDNTLKDHKVNTDLRFRELMQEIKEMNGNQKRATEEVVDRVDTLESFQEKAQGFMTATRIFFSVLATVFTVLQGAFGYWISNQLERISAQEASLHRIELRLDSVSQKVDTIERKP